MRTEGGAGGNGTVLVHRVIARLNVGGPAMHVVHLTRRLSDGRPFQTRLVVGSPMEGEGDMEYFARERGVEVTRIPTMARRLAPLRDLRSFLALWRLFRRERPRIVHTHTSKAGALGRLAAALAGVPVRIHTYHGHVLGGDYFPPWKTRLFRAVERLLARMTHRLIVLSDAQKREMAEELRIAPPSRFEVVPLGLDLQRFTRSDAEGRRAETPGGAPTGTPAEVRAETRVEVRAGLGLREADEVVGVVGRLVPIKNHELALDAVAALKKRDASGRPLRLLVVGSGEREDELKRYARRAGLQPGDVRWLGWRRDLPRLYAAMDVVALTSDDEGTPVAIIEALAAGVPVVARNVGGVSEVLEGGRWGRLVERSAGPETWARTLSDAVREPPSPGLREAARRSVCRRFGVERLVRDMSRLYSEELRLRTRMRR